MRAVAVPLVVTCAATAVIDAEGCANTPAKESAPLVAEVVDAARPRPRVETLAAVVDAGKGEVRPVAAANFQVSVIDAPAWPESGTGSKRLGYLRAGSTVTAWDKPTHVNEDCTIGWHQLEGGGYVCGRAVTFDLKDPRVRLAPKPADRDAGMPYRYGVNVGDGTPLYRRVLSASDRAKFENEHKLAKTASREEDADKEDDAIASAAAPSSEEERDSSSSSASSSPSSSATSSRRDRDRDAGAPEKPRLRDLKGHGVLVRKMKTGFYLALDRDFRAAQTRWWRTTFGFAVPFDRIMLQPGVTKHSGAWFLDAPESAPVYDVDAGAALFGDGGAVASYAGVVGFVTHGSARKIEIDADATKAAWGAELPRRSAVLLTGRSATIAGVTYHQTSAGFWVRLSDLKFAKPAPPSDLAPNEKWIDVDITRQALVAFEGLRPVFATLVSSGRRNPQDKERDFPTPTGTFHIREKHVTTTMDGDVASDGPYSIEDVPWVMYFHASYALHGAFWHDQFGHQRSHGCVNLAPEDARTLFGWADPPLPEGWHGVFAKDDKSGTRVVVHEDKEPRRRRPPADPSQ